jgi:hypothetical protein
MQNSSRYIILILSIAVAMGMSLRAGAQEILHDLLPEAASTFTTAEDWDSSAVHHTFTLNNGKTFQIPNPKQSKELKPFYERFSAMNTEDRNVFSRRRRDALVAIARLFTSGGVVPTKFTNSLLEYFDDYMMVSAAAVVKSNDFGISITTNAGAGLAIPSTVGKHVKKAGEIFGKSGGFYFGSGGGINIGFVPSEKTAYLEIVADFETLKASHTPLVQLNHTFRAYFYGRSKNSSQLPPIEQGRLTNPPIPLVTGMNTDRGFYLGVAGGPSLINFFGPLFKNVIMPIVDQATSYTTNFNRIHLLRIAVSKSDSKAPVAIEFPIFHHPVFESTDALISAMHRAHEKVLATANATENRIYELWPEPESCVITLGLSQGELLR